MRPNEKKGDWRRQDPMSGRCQPRNHTKTAGNGLSGRQSYSLTRWESCNYSSREHGEVDFIVERMGKVLPVEVKSGKHYQRHRALNRMMGIPDYAIPEAVVLDDVAHKVESGVHYAPVYMAMFLEHETLPEKMPYENGSPITPSSFVIRS